jgi:tetratricopeptide (TPR) repeat protein
MITGSLPFDGDTWEELKEQHQKRQAASLPEAVPSRLNALVSTCLKKNPVERFADFAVLRQELSAIYEEVAGAKVPEQAVGTQLDAVEWSNKGVSLSELERYEEALDCYARALNLTAELKEVWNNKGLALRGLHRYSEALDSFDRALALDPSFALAWRNKALTLDSLGRRIDALSCYGRAILQLGFRYRVLGVGFRRTAKAMSREHGAGSLGRKTISI